MKRISFTIILGLFAITAMFGQAPKEETKQDGGIENSIRVHPLNLFVGQVGFSYERLLKPGRSLDITVIQEFELDESTTEADNSYYLGLLDVGYRFYFKDRDLEGWFVEPAANLQYENTKVDFQNGIQRTRDRFTVGAGVEAGYQWILKRGITLGTSLGTHYEVEFRASDTYHSLQPRLNFSVGYSW